MAPLGNLSTALVLPKDVTRLSVDRAITMLKSLPDQDIVRDSVKKVLEFALLYVLLLSSTLEVQSVRYWFFWDIH